MIPKIIHYCWFGGNPLPDSAKKCIASWRKFFPDYEIWQWSEELLDDNSLSPTLPSREGGSVGKGKNLFDKIQVFDAKMIQYTREAYEAKKYAFVSDYARFWILYKYGGLYFDTDVEVIKSMVDIVERGPFMGIEVAATNGRTPKVNPGIGLGVIPGIGLYKELLDKYATLHFINEDGSLNQATIVSYTTEVLQKNGLRPTNEIQEVAGVWIYPADYFNPLDSLTGRLNLSDNTRSIHWYMNSWSDTSKLYKMLSKLSHRLFGTKFSNSKIKSCIFKK